MPNTPKPIALIVLDGWGHSDSSDSNAIKAAHTPVWDKIWQDRPHSLISASGLDVGLPDEQMGNSEVGHMVMGAGRVIYQSLSRISKSIEDQSFFSNPALCAAIDKAVAAGKAVHICGLLSPGGVHSHQDHIQAAVELAARRGSTVYVHAFLDGRDTPPRSAQPSLEKISLQLAELGCGRVASVIGRYYAMDRDNRWERVEKAYSAMALGNAEHSAASAIEALAQAYDRGEDDEFVQPTLVYGEGQSAACMEDGDAVICMNFRADRAREITRAFVEENFDGFQRGSKPKLADYVMLTEYAADIDTPCAFPTEDLPNVLGQYLADAGKTQLRIAETEKYAHVTFFFSGGQENTFAGEDRVLIPSPDVATYDLQPEMSAPEVTDKLVEVIEKQEYDLIVCNYANGDMVGHTGKFDAAVQAVETLDNCLGRVVAALEKAGGECLITADHGNVEQMNDPHSGQAHTAHTSELVPFVYIGQRQVKMGDGGGLADVAPTLLQLLGLQQPAEMTGKSLLQLGQPVPKGRPAL